MSDEAKKKMATAATQAKHAVANVEEATELQADEIMNNVVQAVPFATRHKSLVLVSAGFVGGVVVYPLVIKTLVKRMQKQDERNAEAKLARVA